jgi:hypothetical protein
VLTGGERFRVPGADAADVQHAAVVGPEHTTVKQGGGEAPAPADDSLADGAAVVQDDRAGRAGRGDRKAPIDLQRVPAVG